MRDDERARAVTGRRRGAILAFGVVAIVALIGALVDRSSASSGTEPQPTPTVSAEAAPPMSAPSEPAAGPPERLPREQRGLGEADGIVPAGTTVFDDEVPAVAKLDASLLGALRRAAVDAARGRVQIYVDSGWRSARYQAELLRRAIDKYGSETEAARWVATPDTSAHVSGDAVDLGRSSALAWLSKHGAAYGLCRIYRNEPWHYELRPDAVDRGCPRMYADAASDPRMQR